MKNLKNYVALVVMLMAVVLFTANCGGDDEGPITREDFLGTYSAIETCQGEGIEEKDVVIKLGAMDNEVILSNMSDLHTELIGIVSTDTLHIKDQDAQTAAFGDLYFNNTEGKEAILREGELELDY